MAETTSAPPQPKPLLLGRFEVGKLLGHGTFAKVYLARDASSGESVAIKVLDKERILRRGLAAHIKREVAVLRRVRHPHVVRLLEVMATRARIYFVMELVRGGELFARVSKGRLRETAARRVFQQLLSAVAFCHARGVFHRDIKPENLLLDEHGGLKVSDFGLSAVADEARRGDGLFHTLCGTPAYLAPEVLARRGYDAGKADVWSCGVVLFVLAAGYLPFRHPNLPAMCRKIQGGDFRCPAWFSADLSRLVSRLLDTNPKTRITIPEIMATRWFKKGFHPNDRRCGSDDIELGLARPASLNAFDIISFAPGLDLSALFEEQGEEARFVSREPAASIISKLEEIARVVSFTVRQKDEWRVSMEGTREGEKGRLAIAAEVFELTPSLVVVEVKKKAGDKGEYDEFCNRELKPGLQNLIYGQTAIATAAVMHITSDTV